MATTKTTTPKTTATKTTTKKVLTGPNPNTRKPDLAYMLAWQECCLVSTSPLTGAKIGQSTELYNELLAMYHDEVEKNIALAKPYTRQDVEATRTTNKYYLPTSVRDQTTKTSVKKVTTVTPAEAAPIKVTVTKKTQPKVAIATPIMVDYAYIHQWRTNNTINPETGKGVKTGLGPWAKCEAKCVELEQLRGTITAKTPCVTCASTVKSSTGCCLKCLRAQLNDDTVV